MKDGAILFSALQVMVRILNTTSTVWFKRPSFQFFLKPQCFISALLHGFDKLFCSRTFNKHSIGLLYDVKNYLCRSRRMLKQPLRQPPEICIILHIIRIKPNSLVGLLFIQILLRRQMTPIEQSSMYFCQRIVQFQKISRFQKAGVFYFCLVYSVVNSQAAALYTAKPDIARKRGC